jgi:RHS repeat-associated protein
MYDYNGGGSTPNSSFSYDNNGNLTSETNDNSQVVNYQYDAAGKVTCIGYPVSSSTNCTQAGSTSNTVVNFGYDSAGRLTSTTDWLSPPNTTNYSYSTDGLSNLTKITYPSSSGESITYGYDPASNLNAANYAGPAVGTANQSWTVNADSLFNSTSQLGGYSSSPTYDGIHNWLYKNTNAGATGASMYLYNSNGELASDTPPSKSAITYTYNTGDQLTQRVNPNTGVTDTYAYNPAGERCWSKSANISNPSCASPPSSATSYAWTPLSQLCWSGTTASTNACSSPPTGVTTYTYDGTGLRMTEKTSTATNNFAWDEVTGGKLPRLLVDAANAYIYGPVLFGGSAPVEQITLSNNTPRYLSSVPQGVQLVFSSTGSLLNRSSYSTWGGQTNTNGSNKSPFGFEGGYTDTSGLIYLNARYYDPATAQFLSVDPLVQQTGQPFAYAGDNPINWSDPSGLDCRNTNTCPGGTGWTTEDPGSSSGGSLTPGQATFIGCAQQYGVAACSNFFTNGGQLPNYTSLQVLDAFTPILLTLGATPVPAQVGQSLATLGSTAIAVASQLLGSSGIPPQPPRGQPLRPPSIEAPAPESPPAVIGPPPPWLNIEEDTPGLDIIAPIITPGALNPCSWAGTRAIDPGICSGPVIS